MNLYKRTQEKWICNLKFQDLWSWIKIWSKNLKKIQETHKFDQENQENQEESKRIQEKSRI